MATYNITEAFDSLRADMAKAHASLKTDIAFLKAHAVIAYLLAGGIFGFLAGHFL